VSSTNRLAVSGQVKASPSEVYLIVTDPAMHVKIDGSGMLVTALDSKRLEAPGDTFEMAMDRESLGDIPMGKYQVLNTVTRIVPDTLVEWNVGTAEHGAFGHLYGWEISTVDGATVVTNYCDWNNIPEEARDRFPIVPQAMMEQSVERLIALADGSA
jgi:hypothetical protein